MNAEMIENIITHGASHASDMRTLLVANVIDCLVADDGGGWEMAASFIPVAEGIVDQIMPIIRAAPEAL